MKRNLGLIIFLFAWMGFVNPVNAQKVLVTDDATVSAPGTLLHIHKSGTGGDILQLTNGNTGSTSLNGLKFNLNLDTANIINQENASIKFWTNNIRRMTIDASGNVHMTGDLTYLLIHGVASADSMVPVYTPDVTQNIYSKINTTKLSPHEADGITIAGDSIQVLTAGDYRIDLSVTIAGSNNNQYRIKLYKNNLPSATSLGRFVITTTNNTRYDTFGYFWYVTASVNDYYSFRITNLTNSDSPKISDYKVLITKMPE